MKLELKRTYKGDQYTIGHLYINGIFLCDTIEDVYRGTTDDMKFTKTGNSIGYWTDSEGNKIEKVYGKTAIPTGTYKVEVTFSNKFKKDLPLLKDVKGFDGIRIHSGNTEEDSLGCIIVGENKVKGKVINSRIKFNALMEALAPAIKSGEEITITIF